MTRADLAALAAAARAQPVEQIVEPLDAKPYDLFVARTGALRWIGRKVPAAPEPGAAPIKCCLVDASMIAGLLDTFQVSSDGVIAHVRPIDDRGRSLVFEALAGSPRTDLHYPFDRIVTSSTPGSGSPDDDWVPTPERVTELDAAEVPLRRHSISVLHRYGFEGGRVYDAACSTGAFLGNIRCRFPGAWTIGQDLSAPMVEFARTRVHEVHEGDSNVPCVDDSSVDVLIVRHLNVDVVSTAEAHRLFAASGATVAPGGLVLVMGHTPVLLASASFEAAGFEVLERLGTTGSGDAVFQFYVLRKPARR